MHFAAWTNSKVLLPKVIPLLLVLLSPFGYASLFVSVFPSFCPRAETLNMLFMNFH